MANRYANLPGAAKIKDTYDRINQGFDLVEQDVDQLRADLDQEIADREAAVEYVDQRIDNIIVGGGPDKDPELVDIRSLDPSYTPQREINVAGDVTRDMQEQIIKTRDNILGVLSIEETGTNRFDVGTPGSGFVTFVDDDGHADVLNVLKPMFDAHGKKFTAAIITSYPDNDPNYMTWDQIVDLYRSGFDIVSHTHTHRRLGDMTDEEQLFEMIESRRQLLLRGIDPKHLVYPQGDYNDFTLTHILRYYKSGVATQLSAYMDGLTPPLVEARISRISLGSWQTLTTSEIKAKIDAAVAQGRWLIFTTHIWANNHNNPPEGNVAAIQEILNYCVTNNVNIVTYDEGFRRYANRLSIGNNDIPGKPYYIIGADLKEYTNVSDLQKKIIFYPSSAGLDGTEPPSFFVANATSIAEIPGTRATNMPGNRAGILTTERYGINLGYTKQIYKHHSRTDMFIRTANDDDTWSNWVKVSTEAV